MHQAVAVPLPPSGKEETQETPQLADYDSNDSKDDPIVSEAICPFVIKSRLVVPKTGDQGEMEIIIDTGCTRCLVSLPTVQKLGIRTKPLANPICFEQIDGSQIGGPQPRVSLSS